jgi:hypothetical protein
MEVLQLLIAGDVARRRVEHSLERGGREPVKAAAERPRRVRARAASAAALRSLAERVEPSPT